MKKKRISIICSLLLAMVFALPSAQAAIIDFGTGLGFGGTITAAAGGNYVGTGIALDALHFYADGSSIPVSYDLLGPGGSNNPIFHNGAAILNFSTANNTIEIWGGVASLNDGSTLITPTLLMTGHFTSFTYVAGPEGAFSFNGTGPDTKSRELLGALGLSPNTRFEYMTFAFGGIGGVVTSVDVQNTSVPEPSSLLLIGSGLVVAGLYRRRRRG